MTNENLKYAEQLINDGYSIIPVNIQTKKSIGEWKQFMKRRMSFGEFSACVTGLNGTAAFAIVCGAVSGNLEVIDIDNKLGNATEFMKELFQDETLKGMRDKGLFVVETTKNGGYHIYYRCREIGGNQKLARMTINGITECVAETRGEGGYVLCAPNTGYRLLIGNLSKVSEITVEQRDYLINLIKSKNTYFENYKNPAPKKSDGNRIGDIFNISQEASNIITDLLTEKGYKYMYSKGDSQFWRRPGKNDKSVSVCYDGKTLFVWSTNCLPFESEHAYNNFYIFAYLKHNGDFTAAARDLAEMGFAPEETEQGKQKKKKKSDEINIKHFLKIYNGGEKYETDYRLLKEFLTNAGFRRYDFKDDFIFIRIIDKILHYVYPHNIGDFIQSHFEGEELNYLLKNIKNLTRKDQLATLLKFDGEILTDTKDIIYLYYKDHFVEITSSGAETKPYEDLPKYIWANQIIQRNINIEIEQKESVIVQFIRNITNWTNTPARFSAILSYIGYMISRFKDPSNAKVLILTDEGDANNIDADASQGGTGKGLIGQIISKVRNTVIIDGKSFKFDSQFKWQNVKDDTDVIFFDETKKHFPFENLFSIITGDIEVEAKNQPSYVIPFDRSPKIMIATNYTIPDQSVSTRRRILELELHAFYNENHQPIDDFGKNFFSDWTLEEWYYFDIFIISCVQFFLQNGLMKYETINLNERKLAQSVDESFQGYFFNWVSRQQPAIDNTIKVYFYDFYQEYKTSSDYNKFISNTRSTQNIKKILDFKKIEYKVKSDGKKRYITINNIGELINDTPVF